MNKRQKNLDMTQGSPTRSLILFAIPMWIGGIFQLLYNLVDTWVVGKFVDLHALSAMGSAATTVFFLMMMGQGVTNAVSVILAQAEGSRQEGQMKKAVAHAYYLTLATGLILGIFSLFGARPLMKALQTPAETIDQAVLYIQIVGGLSIGQIAYNCSTSALRAIGDSRTPLYFLIFSSLLNVALDLLFVIAFHRGIDGVAWATVISQIISAVLCNAYMLRKYKKLCPDKEAWKFDGKILREYFKIGLPMCVQSAVLCVGDMIITSVINSHGANVMAAYTIGSKVQQLATVSFSNLAFSFSVYSGQNFGAKLYGRIKEGLKKGLALIVGLALVSTVIMLIFAPRLAPLFMKEENEFVLTASVWLIRIQAVLFVALGAIWAVNSALRGVSQVNITLVSSIVELASKIGLSLLLPFIFGSLGMEEYFGIWLAAPIGWILGLIPSSICMKRWFKKMEDPKLNGIRPSDQPTNG